MKNNAFLKGKNVYLRPLKIEDVSENYISWLNDPEICEYNSHHVFPYNEYKAEEYLKSISLSDKALVLAIIENETDKHIGNVSLQNINTLNRNAEFAIIIGDKDYLGKGFSKEIASLVLEHGFTELNLHRIYCGTAEGNIAMQKLAQFLGMKEEGRRKEAQFKNGKYNDILEYGILRDEFVNKSR